MSSHYLTQVQGQSVCLDYCDFFQVKIEEYENFEEYEKDIFVDDDVILAGRTNLNYPKGVTVSYRKKGELKLTYLYPSLNMTDQEYKDWIIEKKIEIIKDKHEYVESKWWKISRYECTLIESRLIGGIKMLNIFLSFMIIYKYISLPLLVNQKHMF